MVSLGRFLTQLVCRFKEIIFIAAIFIAVAVPYLEYDYFSGDEIVPASLAVNTIIGNPNGRHTSVYINALGRILPVNRICAYDFALPAYFLIPFIKIFGVSIYLVKIVAAGISLLYLLVLFAVIAMLFGRQTALVTVVLLEVSPLFIHYARSGFNTTEPIINLIFISSVYCFLIYKRRHNNIYIYAAVFLLGACLSVKLSAFSRYLGILAGFIIVYPKRIVPFIRASGLYRNLLLAVFFSCGAFLFLYYNAAAEGRSFALVNCLTRNEPTFSGEKNSDIIQHARQRIKQFASFAADAVPYHSLETAAVSRAVSGISLLLFFAAFIAVLLSALRESSPERNKIIFIYVFFITGFLTTLFSPGSFRPFHLSILYPFVQLVIALFVVGMFNSRDNISVKRAVAAIVLITALAVKGTLLYDYHSAYAKVSKSNNTNDEAIGGLIEYIELNKLFPCVFSDFGTDEAVFYLSKARVASFDVGGGIFEQGKIKTVGYMKRQASVYGNIYVVETPQKKKQKLSRLKEYAVSKGIRIEIVKKIAEKNSGEARYIIYRIHQVN
ncbi:MAG: glycosyltransferase family 39 protein [Candidatus Omnitrophota bacterium]